MYLSSPQGRIVCQTIPLGRLKPLLGEWILIIIMCCPLLKRGQFSKETFCSPWMAAHLLQYACVRALVVFITRTCLYNFDTLKPHFYIVKLGFTGVCIYLSFFLLKSIDCGYALEPPHRVLKSTHNLCFEQTFEEYQNFLSENFHFFCVNIFIIFE